VITSQTWERFAHVMGPKVLGAWHLHQLAGTLDFMVLFSSGASVAGSAGQSNHAAANAFEDALAWYRQAQGQPTVSINWGPWAEIGAAVDRQIGSGKFLRPIVPEDGIAALEYAMRRDRNTKLFALSQVAALSTDWAHLSAIDAAALPPLLTELRVERRAHVPQQVERRDETRVESGLLDALRSAPANRRRAVLRDRVRSLTERVLGGDRGIEVDVNAPLRQMGLDSLMAVELRNRLGKEIGHALPSTLTFDHPSVEAIVAHIAENVLQSEFADATAMSAPAPATDTAAAKFSDLSADELADQLRNRLSRLSRRMDA
jgi:acyl carrier protein